MNQIIQHIPNYFSGFTPEVAEFETVDELLNIPFVKHHEKEGHSFQMSDLNLMIVKDDESWWWVVGTVKFPDRVDLPKWETESMKRMRLENERKKAVNEMQRLLKFRIWNARSESFESDSHFALIDFTLGFDGYHFQQYTGLKDRNGIEIYEGDIISYHRDKYEIVYSHGCFGLEMEDDDYGGSKLVPLNEIHQMISNEEVIGNIHENGGLLK